ncbi:Tyrosine recombinase XerC [subsurface metagenome]
MIEVRAIKDKAKIGAIKDYLKDRNVRDYLLFVAGCNLAIRISDLLSLKVDQVRDNQGNIREFIRLKEQKNRKQRELSVNKALTTALTTFFKQSPVLEKESPLFPGVKSDKAMTRQNAHFIIKNACRAVGLEGNYSTHSLRKSWGYAAYSQGVRIEEIMKKLGHASPGVTLRYIGIEQEDTHKLEEQICL